MSDEAVTEVDIKKMAEKIVGSRNLLRKYIGKEAIRVDAYKIDQNPQTQVIVLGNRHRSTTPVRKNSLSTSLSFYL